MNGLVVCFAGKIGSGKTSVTYALAQCLGWRRVSFGDYIRAELARRGGNPELRAELQDLGQRLVDSDPLSLCRAVLGAGEFCPGGDLLVDGIRHVTVYRMIVDIVKPSQARLFYLRASDEARVWRIAQRGEAVPASAVSHPVEAESATIIPEMADAIIDASGSLRDTLLLCVNSLGAHGVASDLIASCQQRAQELSASQ